MFKANSVQRERRSLSASLLLPASSVLDITHLSCAPCEPPWIPEHYGSMDSCVHGTSRTLYVEGGWVGEGNNRCCWCLSPLLMCMFPCLLGLHPQGISLSTKLFKISKEEYQIYQIIKPNINQSWLTKLGNVKFYVLCYAALCSLFELCLITCNRKH